MNDQQVSIVVPTASLGDKSLAMLEKCMQSILMQDYEHINVVITDHSIDDEIKDYLDVHWNHQLKILYLKFEEKRGFGVANTNHGINHVPDDHFVAIMCQDNYYFTNNAISTMVSTIQITGTHWCAVGCNHVDDDYKDLNHNHSPRWIPGLSMALGMNRIGGPSVVMVKQCDMRQDEELTYLNDCEWYYRLGMKYGPPALIPTMMVTISMRESAVSSTMDIPQVKWNEQQYVEKKHG